MDPRRANRSSGSRPSATGMFWLMGIVIFGLLYGLLAASVPSSVATRAARGTSLTDVKVTGSSIWAAEIFCGDDDIKMFWITGTNVQGDQVHIRVCVTPWRTAHIKY